MFTRRQTLLGTAAAASFAAPVAMAEYLNRAGDDADLMQRARTFHQDYPTRLEAGAAWTRAAQAIPERERWSRCRAWEGLHHRNLWREAA